jgi:hypothetical protein
MADTTYIVQIKLETEGDAVPEQKLRGGAQAADNLGTRLSGIMQSVNALGTLSPNILGKFTGALEWAAGKAWEVGKALGALAVTTGVAAVTWGVMKLNSELETTRTSLGAIFTAQGQAGTLNAGLELASDTIVQMRKDAALLPGEFSDLLNIMSTTAIPAFQAGLDVDGLREMSSKLMASGVVASMPLDMVAREAAQLMGGRAGGHNVLGQRLMGLHGDTAKQFNKMTAADRLEKINTELDKYSGAIQVFGQGWEGLSSTAVDAGKEWVRMMSEPLFDVLKTDLGGINEWFDQNQSLLSAWAQVIGQKLVEAWDWGKKKILEWWPLIQNFASVAMDRLKAVWVDIEPAVVRIGEALKEALADPNGSIDKLITLAKLWGVAKVSGGVLGMGGKVVGAGAQTYIGLAQAGLVGGGGAATAAGGAAAGGVGAGAGAGGLLGGGAMAALGTAAATAGAALAALGGLAWAGYEAFKVWELNKDLETIHIQKMTWQAENFVKKAEEMGNMTGMTADVIADLRDQGEFATAELYETALAAAQAAANLRTIQARETEGKVAAITASSTASIMTVLGSQVERGIATAGAVTARSKKHGKKHPGGGGGTSIQKVEIVVTSNQNPSRIARSVTDELAKLARVRQTSPHVTDYSSLGQRGGDLG